MSENDNPLAIWYVSPQKNLNELKEIDSSLKYIFYIILSDISSIMLFKENYINKYIGHQAFCHATRCTHFSDNVKILH